MSSRGSLMLITMPSAATAAPLRNSRSFAGLLEEYAAPAAKFPPAGDMDGLEDDIATLSYEHALRAHARYRPAPEPALGPTPMSTSKASLDQLPAKARQEKLDAGGSQAAATVSASEGRKSSSVTVRLTAAEDEQLRQRAAEAKLTVSAYLRFCAFEVESLRAQVKEAVARMKEADSAFSRQPARASLWQRLRRLLRKSNRT